MKAIVPCELPGRAIEMRDQNARLAVVGTVDHDAITARVGRKPVRQERRVGSQRRYLDGMCRIADVEADDSAPIGDRNNPVPPSDNRNRAPFSPDMLESVNRFDARLI